MGALQRQWARKVKSKLREQLGNRCAVCSVPAWAEQLDFDCIEPRGHWHHRAEQSMRATFYRREYEAGNLQLLCRDCHTLKTKQDAEIPF